MTHRSPRTRQSPVWRSGPSPCETPIAPVLPKLSCLGTPRRTPNVSNFVRGYDPASGKELWRLGGSSKITAPTPVYAADLIVVASGRRPEAPIFAIRAGATGDITRTSFVVWQK